MTEPSAAPSPWPWTFLNPFMTAGAPQTLDQPILPGWIFANSVSVNETNSSAPEVERSIVSQESYGRQLGCILGALADLIETRPEDERTKAMRDLLALNAKIDRIKVQGTEQRLQSTSEWLAHLKTRDPEAFRAAAKRLRAAIDGLD